MKKILFVCSSNVCSSVMAQYMMQSMIDSIGAGRRYLVDSAATGKTWNGEQICPQARKKLEERNIPVGDHVSRVMTWEDYDRFDLLIGMDDPTIEEMHYLVGSDPDGKIQKLRAEDVEDPWYTDRYDIACKEIQEGLMDLLNRLQ